MDIIQYFLNYVTTLYQNYCWLLMLPCRLAEEISFIHDRMPVMLDPAQPLPASFFANDTLADQFSTHTAPFPGVREQIQACCD